jgi:DNA-directed RNA polymerase subunit M/transcription elongation factor TFIIS
MRQCRDCSVLIPAGKVLLCPACRAAAREKRRAMKRDNAQASYQSERKSAVPGDLSPARVIKPPRTCLTEGCTNPAPAGKAVYCPACSRQRRLLRQKRYREESKADLLDLPPDPPTSLAWLDKFSAWAKSGLSYAEYQRAGWLQRGK